MNRTLSRTCVLALLIFVWIAAACARAESFNVYAISGDNGYNIVGIDAAGDVVLSSPFGCSSSDPNNCYLTYSQGNLVSKSDTLSGFTTDNGAACSYSAPAGITSAGKSVCNGGYQVAGIFGDSIGDGVIEIASGSGAFNDPIFRGTADVLVVNGSGDFAVTDGLNDVIYQVVAVTPEPAAFVLFATAGFGILWLRRRKLARLD